MIAKKTFYKLYFKLICLSLVIFLSISNLAMSAVLTEEEIKYIESQSEDSNKDGKYIKYEDIKEQKTKKNPFIFLAQKRKKQKKKLKKKKV